MMSNLSGATPQHIDRRMGLAREWDELVDQVRGIPGFEDFLRAPRLETLLPAARNGPVVVVNISRWRCDAIIVTADEVHIERLTDLTADDVEQRVRRTARFRSAGCEMVDESADGDAVANDRADLEVVDVGVIGEVRAAEEREGPIGGDDLGVHGAPVTAGAAPFVIRPLP